MLRWPHTSLSTRCRSPLAILPQRTPPGHSAVGRCLLPLAALAFAALAAGAAAAISPSRVGTSWAEAQIRAVTSHAVLGSSLAAFDPEGVLTERALAAAIKRVDALQNPLPPPAPVTTPAPVPAPAPKPVAAPPPSSPPTTTTPAPPPSPPPVEVLSTIPAGATIGGTDPWQITVPNQSVADVAFAVDGVQQGVASQPPFVLVGSGGGLDTTTLADGPHQLAVAVHLADGATYVAAWQVEVANAPGSTLTPLPVAPTAVPITEAPPRSSLEAAPRALVPPDAETAVPASDSASAAPAASLSAAIPRVLYRADAPAQPVTIRELDAAIIEYLGLGGAAQEVQTTLQAAGLNPPPNTGTEVVARLLDLRLTHPTPSENYLDLLPNQPATRAEAAYSFARLLELGGSSEGWVDSLVQSFTVPALNAWQRRILTTAVQYVGYPYVWGGTSPTTEAPFGVEAPGGFDCSGFVWQVYKLTPYPGERGLAGVLVGRTTYVMSGEVPDSDRIPAAKLEPADVMFFGVGLHSQPSQVDHTAIYMGDGWLIQSSGEGVTIAPFDTHYRGTFAWARRPLREAGLT